MGFLTKFVAVGLLVVSVGCESEIDGKTAAVVTEPPPTAVEKPAEKTSEPEAKRVPFDLANSKVEWAAGKVVGGDEQGGFKTFEGSVTFDDAGRLATVDAKIDTTSVFTSKDKLTNHLKSPDFFSTTEFPTATFVSSKIEHDQDGAVVTGLLDLRGVKKEISFPAKIVTEGANTVATAEFTLMRFDFGIEYKGKPDNMVRGEVLMRLQIAAPKQE